MLQYCECAYRIAAPAAAIALAYAVDRHYCTWPLPQLCMHCYATTTDSYKSYYFRHRSLHRS
eukprot:15733-Heterococcus_DN1.PRE.4